MIKVLVIHGPNLNLLGKREPGIYGNKTLDDINADLQVLAAELKAELKIFQSNVEGEIVNCIQENAPWADALLINPAAYTHTSVAIPDAISGTQVPTVEIHLSNIYKREEIRHTSLVAPVSLGQISGFGPLSYQLGLRAVCAWIMDNSEA